MMVSNIIPGNMILYHLFKAGYMYYYCNLTQAFLLILFCIFEKAIDSCPKCFYFDSFAYCLS